MARVKGTSQEDVLSAEVTQSGERSVLPGEVRAKRVSQGSCVSRRVKSELGG